MSSHRDYLAPYHEATSEHGSDFGVTLWASPESQRRRFAVMTEMADLAGKRVLDAGCSRGDFAAYLLEHGIEFERYIGVDGLADVIDFAHHRGLPASEFHTGDLVNDPTLFRLGSPQVITLSGTLNTMSNHLALRVLRAAWDATEESLIFNFLSDRSRRPVPYRQDPARRLNTLKLLRWALKQTWAVRFRHDYFQYGHDATIAMRKA